MGSGQRLVVVSNRLPVTLKRVGEEWRVNASSGGLVTAMDPILRRTDGIWIGWPGDSNALGDPTRQEAIDRWAKRQQFIIVDLPERTVELYYEGYSNQAIWPVFHYFPSLFSYARDQWNAYVEANRRFHDVVVQHTRPGDLIWVHDYQLMLLPRMLRESLPEAQIGFFLHIPFPSSELFRLIPGREELLNGLLGADLVAFHTPAHLQHFRSALLRVAGIESQMNAVEVEGRTVRLEALPIGIAPKEFRDLLDNNKETQNFLAEYQQRFEGRRILLSVDRMDYTKGIPQRLRTFQRLLEKDEELRGKVVLLQVTIPSREQVSSYAQLRRQVNELVGEINGQYATPEWTPVINLNRGISRTQLVALYALADIGWVNPLRDGMNLVAKEYVACNRGDGVLVLSELTGAAAEMGEALLVNPFDEEKTVEAIQRALTLPLDERRERMELLRSRVERNNVFHWGERFIEYLGEAASARAYRLNELPKALNLDAISEEYTKANSRLLCFSYDGTLVPYAPIPRQAAPPRNLVDVIRQLATDPQNTVAIVTGRCREELDRWFGDIPELWLAAEYGALVRAAGADEWQAAHPGMSADWKTRIKPTLEQFAERAPGSLVEEKEFSIVWHYRMSDPQFSEWLASELLGFLEGMLGETEVSAVRGIKSIEIRPLWVHKGQVMEELLKRSDGEGFQLALGHDRTDEDLFSRMGPDAWTVRVGQGPTRARFSIASQGDAVSLLKQLAGVARPAYSPRLIGVD